MAGSDGCSPDIDTTASTTDPVWLLTGGRQGEMAQQRAVAEALGLPYREVRVATLAAAGGAADFDDSAFSPPWPRLVISFGLTLTAAVELRRRAGAALRIVQIARPRHVDWTTLDLVVPLPQDRVPATSNMVRVRMPLNLPRVLDATGEDDAATAPSPRTLLIIGGVSRQYRLSATTVKRLIDGVIDRVRAASGSLFISTSPRTPPDVLAILPDALPVPGAIYRFRHGDAANPFARWIHHADEIVMTGDSPSMIAECWRSATPVIVQPLPYTPSYWLKRQARRLLPRSAFVSGRHAAPVDINAWLRELEAQGHIGLWGRSTPRMRYDAAQDDDLSRVVARIRALL